MPPTLPRIRAAASAVFRPLEEGGVLLHVGTGAYFELNASGRFIWEQIAQGTDRAALIQALATQYDLEETTAGADVDEFLAELEARDLLDTTSPAEPD